MRWLETIRNVLGISRKQPGMQMIADLGGGVTMEFAWIPPGDFLMGSPPDEKGRLDGEDIHCVQITKGFWMGKYEVTQKQWERLMGSNPSHFKGEQHPVDTVSWDDCQTFIRELNAKVRGHGFRLPTEAEWEYACRAGTVHRFYTGATDSALNGAGWFHENSGGTTHPVGHKSPNAFGLFDMQGNVSEWCQDRYRRDLYRRRVGRRVKGPAGPWFGQLRVVRGGTWRSTAEGCRSAYRYYGLPTSAFDFLGFRLATSR